LYEGENLEFLAQLPTIALLDRIFRPCVQLSVLGLLTRVSAGALGITMIVAIASAKWDQVDSLETLLGFDETEYLALFLWLAVAGAGRFSIDRLLNRALRA
jgi:uncharacterized membrane protein YphA (DoxX/SURF4 family)